MVWTYSGVRPLYDDGAQSATAATRDYTLKLDERRRRAACSHVFGGKITTYRRLAEAALEKLGAVLAGTRAGPGRRACRCRAATSRWTGSRGWWRTLRAAHPFLDDRWALRLVRAYGTEAAAMLGGAAGGGRPRARLRGHADRGRGALAHGPRMCADAPQDVLWRRCKLGLRLDARPGGALDAWMRAAWGGGAAPGDGREAGAA